MICVNCKAAIPADAVFCPMCGTTMPGKTIRPLEIQAELAREVDRLKATVQSLSPQIAKLSVDLDKLGESLRLGAVQSTPVIPTAPQTAPTAASTTGPAPEVLLEIEANGQDTTQSDATLPPWAAGPSSTQAPTTQAPRATGSTPPPFKLKAPDPDGTAEVNLGQKWLLVLGILATLFGVGYFLKYSFDQGWVGPAGRVALAYLTGMAFIGAGELFRRRDLATYGLCIMGGGFAVLYFATFAGFQFYHIIPQGLAFSLMILTTALAMTLAVAYDTRGLAILGLLGGFLTPVLLSTGEANHLVLFSYITVLNLGLVFVAFRKQWEELNWLGFVSTYLIFSLWYSKHYSADVFWPAVLFLNLFFVIYALAPFAYHLANEGQEKIKGYGITLLNSFVALALCFPMVQNKFGTEWAGVVTLFYALVFLALATFLRQRNPDDEQGMVLLLSNAGLFLALTVPLVFDGPWVTALWLAQGLALQYAGFRLKKDLPHIGAALLMALAVMRLLIKDFDQAFRFNFDQWIYDGGYFFNRLARYAIMLWTMACLFWAGWTAWREAENNPPLPGHEASKVPGAIFTVFGALLFLFANMEFGGYIYEVAPTARFAAFSGLWTVFAAGLMVLGFRLRVRQLRFVSLGLFAVTALKVFFADISRFATPYRILSFIVLGLVLVACSYLYYRHRDRITELMTDPKKEG